MYMYTRTHTLMDKLYYFGTMLYLSRGVGAQADGDMFEDLLHDTIIQTDHLHVATTKREWDTKGLCEYYLHMHWI